MAKHFVQVSVEDLGKATRGRFAGKERHDALVIRQGTPKNGVLLNGDVPTYILEGMLAGKSKMVVYKNTREGSAYMRALRAFGLQTAPVKEKISKNARRKARKSIDLLEVGREFEVSEAAAEGLREPSIEELMEEAEARNAEMDAMNAIAKGNALNISERRLRAIKAELAKAGLGIAGL
jgi:hypothetical protein